MKKRMLMMIAMVAMFFGTASAQHFGGYRYGARTSPSHYGRTPRTARYNSPYNYVGLRVGASFADLSSDWDRYGDCATKTGLNLGMVVGTPVSHYIPLCLETGLTYTEKGGNLDSHTKVNLNYLELPLVLKFIHVTDGGFGIQPYAGGYLACGVGGKIKERGYYDGGSKKDYTTTCDAFGDKGDFKRFDGGLKVGCGFSYDILYADLSYEYGLTNITDDSFRSTHNSALMLNVGVNF